MRKVIGASRGQLASQFLGEALIIAILALPLGIVLYLLARPWFVTFMRMETPLYLWNYPELTLLLGVIIVAVGLISGSYPAFFLSAFQPAVVLKGALKQSVKRGTVRKVLVVIQFVLSVTLIIFAIVTARQFNYLNEVNLGYERKNLLCTQFRGESREMMEILLDEVKQHPGVMNACRSMWIPVDWGSTGPGNKIIPEGHDENEYTHAKVYPASYDFVETLQLHILSGRSFSRQHDDEGSVLISQQLAMNLPWDDPLGRQIHLGEHVGTIIGIVNDFHFQHVFFPLQAGLFYLEPDPMNYLLIRYRPESQQDVEDFVEQKWDQLLPEYPYESLILDDHFREMFKNTVKGKELIVLLSTVAIFFSCLGLLGLASYVVERRTNEIAVRKVLGASTSGVAFMLLRGFLGLVLLSNALAWPAGYFLSRWFINWAWVYDINISLDIFIAAMLISLLTATLAVVGQVLRAAKSNPVDALKTE